MTGAAGPLGTPRRGRRRREADALVSVLKKACDGASAKTPAKEQLLGLHAGTDQVPTVPLQTQLTSVVGPLGLLRRERRGRRVHHGAQSAWRSVPCSKSPASRVLLRPRRRHRASANGARPSEPCPGPNTQVPLLSGYLRRLHRRLRPGSMGALVNRTTAGFRAPWHSQSGGEQPAEKGI